MGDWMFWALVYTVLITVGFYIGVLVMALLGMARLDDERGEG
ncbi:MAG TPA: hypothetical protein VIK69_08460 [Methylophilaceae bacterium]